MKKNNGLLVVLSAPSGCGKDTILKSLLETTQTVKKSVSATTRAPREGEVNGVDYWFTPKSDFEAAIGRGEFLEYATYCGEYYGTPQGPVRKWLEDGTDVVLKIEVQGGAQVKKLAPDCVTIFVLPPSLEELERRLRTRGTDSEEKIRERLQTAVREMQCAGEYDYIVYNDTVEQAVRDILTVIAAEKLRFARDPQVVERMLSHAETFCK